MAAVAPRLPERDGLDHETKVIIHRPWLWVRFVNLLVESACASGSECCVLMFIRNHRVNLFFVERWCTFKSLSCSGRLQWQPDDDDISTKMSV